MKATLLTLLSSATVAVSAAVKLLIDERGYI